MRSPNPGVAPTRVVGSKPDYELLQPGRSRRPAWPTPTGAVVLLGHELAVPAKDGIGRDDGVEALEHTPGQQAALAREAAALVIGEPEPAATQLLAENPILLDEVVDDGLLAAVHPSGKEQEQELQRRRRHRADSTLGR